VLSGGSPPIIADAAGWAGGRVGDDAGFGHPAQRPDQAAVRGVHDRRQGAGVAGGVEPHLVEVPGRGLIVEIQQGTADPHRNRSTGAARVLGGDLDVLVPDQPDHRQHRLLLLVGHDRSAHNVG
jgi:hypothetical protein